MKCVLKQSPSSATRLGTHVSVIIPRLSLALNRGVVETADQLHVCHLTDLVSTLGLFLPFLMLVIHADPTLPLPWEDRQTAALAPFLPIGLTWRVRVEAPTDFL